MIVQARCLTWIVPEEIEMDSVVPESVSGLMKNQA